MLHWISSTYSKRLLIWKDEQETGGDPGGPTRKQNETVAGDWKRPVKALVGCYRPLAQPEGHWLGGMRLNNKQLMIELAMPVAFPISPVRFPPQSSVKFLMAQTSGLISLMKRKRVFCGACRHRKKI